MLCHSLSSLDDKKSQQQRHQSLYNSLGWKNHGQGRGLLMLRKLWRLRHRFAGDIFFKFSLKADKMKR